MPEADALSSDLNRDGVVDFNDFFLFADEFGLTGEPDADTVVVVLRDNNIADLSFLLGIGALTDVWLEGNSLDSNASDTVIPTLIDRGAFVRF